MRSLYESDYNPKDLRVYVWVCEWVRAFEMYVMLKHCASHWSINGNTDWHRLAWLFEPFIPYISSMVRTSPVLVQVKRFRTVFFASSIPFLLDFMGKYSNPFHLISNANGRFELLLFQPMFSLNSVCTVKLMFVKNVWSHTFDIKLLITFRTTHTNGERTVHSAVGIIFVCYVFFYACIKLKTFSALNHQPEHQARANSHPLLLHALRFGWLYVYGSFSAPQKIILIEYVV